MFQPISNHVTTCSSKSKLLHLKCNNTNCTKGFQSCVHWGNRIDQVQSICGSNKLKLFLCCSVLYIECLHKDRDILLLRRIFSSSFIKFPPVHEHEGHLSPIRCQDIVIGIFIINVQNDVFNHSHECLTIFGFNLRQCIIDFFLSQQTKNLINSDNTV